MRVIEVYSHLDGLNLLQDNHSCELDEVNHAITSVQATRSKRSKESTMLDRMLYSPVALNKSLKEMLLPNGWAVRKPDGKYSEVAVKIEIPIPSSGEKHTRTLNMDGVKNGVGLEIQFGKYAFVPFDLFVKFPIFLRRPDGDRAKIEVGIEIVPMKALTWKEDEGRLMSSGVPSWENIYAEVKERGEWSGDCPFILIGVDADEVVSTEEAEEIIHHTQPQLF